MLSTLMTLSLGPVTPSMIAPNCPSTIPPKIALPITDCPSTTGVRLNAIYFNGAFSASK